MVGIEHGGTVMTVSFSCRLRSDLLDGTPSKWQLYWLQPRGHS